MTTVHLLLNPLILYFFSVLGAIGIMRFVIFSGEKYYIKLTTLSRFKIICLGIAITNLFILLYLWIEKELINYIYIANGILSHMEWGMRSYAWNGQTEFNYFDFQLMNVIRHVAFALLPVSIFFIGSIKKKRYLTKFGALESKLNLQNENSTKSDETKKIEKKKYILEVIINLILGLIITVFTLSIFLIVMIIYSDSFTFVVFH